MLAEAQTQIARRLPLPFALLAPWIEGTGPHPARDRFPDVPSCQGGNDCPRRPKIYYCL